MTHLEQIEQLLQDSLPSIVEGLKKELTTSVSFEVKHTLNTKVTETVVEWYKENMLSEIQSILVEQKEGLVGIIPALALTVQETLVEAMVKQLKSNLEHSYNRNEILKKLFN